MGALGLDTAALGDCVANDETVRARVEAQIAFGEKIRIPGTPTYYLNGHLLEEAPTDADLNKLLGRPAGDGP